MFLLYFLQNVLIVQQIGISFCWEFQGEKQYEEWVDPSATSFGGEGLKIFYGMLPNFGDAHMLQSIINKKYDRTN